MDTLQIKDNECVAPLCGGKTSDLWDQFNYIIIEIYTHIPKQDELFISFDCI